MNQNSATNADLNYQQQAKVNLTNELKTNVSAFPRAAQSLPYS
jgi:hypothetical protein